jgi:hypothetical protein
MACPCLRIVLRRAADPAEGRGPRFTAEGARDLLLHFDHPQVPFGLIVIAYLDVLLERM